MAKKQPKKPVKIPGEKKRHLPEIKCPKCCRFFTSLIYLASHECYPENRKYWDPKYKNKHKL